MADHGGMDLHATVGDKIEIDTTHVGEGRRTGAIVEVLGSGDQVHYRVRWDDGHESSFFPGSGAHIIHRHQTAP